MEYGKFNSAEELLKGYESLEKSFTQKCQQLAALEKQITITQSGTSESTPPQQSVGRSVANDSVDTVPNASDADSREQVDQSPSELSQDAVRQYLVDHPELAAQLIGATDSLSETSERIIPPRVMTGGGNVSCALPNRPKTLKEASDLAKKYFN